MREEMEAAAAPAQPQGPVSAYQGRVPPVRQAGVSRIRDQGAVCCFQTLLWPHSQPRPPPSFCPLAPPPQMPCSSGSLHRKRLRECHPQCQAHHQGLSWAVVRGLSRQRLPTTCTHSGLGGLAEMGIRSHHCLRSTCSQCSLPGLGTEIHVSKAAESREGAWSLLPSGSSASLGAPADLCGLVGSPGGRAGSL